MVCVVVGRQPNVKEFCVDQTLICRRSEFFEQALRGKWKASERRKVWLPDDELEIFSLYLKAL